MPSSQLKTEVHPERHQLTPPILGRTKYRNPPFLDDVCSTYPILFRDSPKPDIAYHHSRPSNLTGRSRRPMVVLIVKRSVKPMAKLQIEVMRKITRRVSIDSFDYIQMG